MTAQAVGEVGIRANTFSVLALKSSYSERAAESLPALTLKQHQTLGPGLISAILGEVFLLEFGLIILLLSVVRVNRIRSPH